MNTDHNHPGLFSQPHFFLKMMIHHCPSRFNNALHSSQLNLSLVVFFAWCRPTIWYFENGVTSFPLSYREGRRVSIFQLHLMSLYLQKYRFLDANLFLVFFFSWQQTMLVFPQLLYDRKIWHLYCTCRHHILYVHLQWNPGLTSQIDSQLHVTVYPDCQC